MDTKYELITQEKLAEAKHKCELFAMDYDGTLADGESFQFGEAIGLVKEILQKNKTPAIITARAATAVKIFVPPLEEYYSQNQKSNSTYIGGGNGTVLYKVYSKGIERIYNHGLSLAEIKTIAHVWEDYAKENLKTENLNEKGLVTFQKFYSETWEGLIPEEVLAIGRPFGGRIFTEEAKFTFVLPKDVSRHTASIEAMQGLVGDSFSVVAGGVDFCHITKRLSEDSKKVAIKTILESLGLSEDQVVTFGDMPHGNDAGLLSFPYSFTNSSEFAKIKSDPEQPPFILPALESSPVARVYKAIHYLLS